MSAYPRVFVAKLSSDTDEAALNAFFSRWVKVRQAWIVRDEGTGLSKNYGFVEVEGADDLGAALELDGYRWNDRQIVVKLASNNKRNRGSNE